MISILVPIKPVSITNTREHWAKRAKRAKLHRQVARLTMMTSGVKKVGGCVNRASCAHIKFSEICWAEVRILLTRLYTGRGKPMDTDNLTSSTKSVRDGIADWLGIDDGDSRIEWKYAQERSKSYGVRVEIV